MTVTPGTGTSVERVPGLGTRRWRRLITSSLVGLSLATQVPVVAAHDGSEYAALDPWHGLLIMGLGIGLIIGCVAAKRTDRLSSAHALYTILGGITIAALGAVLFDGLSGDPVFTAETMPFPRAWYTPLAILAGLGTILVSFVVTLVRWPTRPRYAAFGILAGAWFLYPELLSEPAASTHPLGYLLVLGTPVLVGYIVWKDAWGVLATVLRDPVVRRFSIGVGTVVTLFITTSTGYLSVFPDEATPMEPVAAVFPAVYQLVSWPTLEMFFPQIPLFVALSVGLVVLNGTIGVLVGLNAALIARYWRVQARSGTTEGTVGAAAIMGSCTCGCCGPLVAKFAIVAAGPTVAAPLYWLFVDSASPLAVAFIIGSIALFTGTLVYAAQTTTQDAHPVCAVPAD